MRFLREALLLVFVMGAVLYLYLVAAGAALRFLTSAASPPAVENQISRQSGQVE